MFAEQIGDDAGLEDDAAEEGKAKRTDADSDQSNSEVDEDGEESDNSSGDYAMGEEESDDNAEADDCTSSQFFLLMQHALTHSIDSLSLSLSLADNEATI